MKPPTRFESEQEEIRWINEGHYEPSGRLVFSIRGSHLNSYRQWSDRGRSKLESHIESIIAGLFEVARGAEKRRAEINREIELREERLRIEEEEKERVRKVAEWTRDIGVLVSQRKLALDVRTLIAELEQAAPRDSKGMQGSEFMEWATWAKTHASAIDPVECIKAGLPLRPLETDCDKNCLNGLTRSSSSEWNPNQKWPRRGWN